MNVYGIWLCIWFVLNWISKVYQVINEDGVSEMVTVEVVWVSMVRGLLIWCVYKSTQCVVG